MNASSAQLSHKPVTTSKNSRALVTKAVFVVLVAAEVECFERVGRGDEVPAGAPAAQVVERGEPARHVIRLVVAGAGGGDQADVFGHRRQRGQQGERI
jgi:hypothetical protein